MKKVLFVFACLVYVLLAPAIACYDFMYGSPEQGTKDNSVKVTIVRVRPASVIPVNNSIALQTPRP